MRDSIDNILFPPSSLVVVILAAVPRSPYSGKQLIVTQYSASKTSDLLTAKLSAIQH